MKEKVTLNRKDQKRLMVLNQVGRGVVTCREASALLHLSLRHARRLLAAYRKEGAAALAHGNRGRKPHTHAACFGTILSIQCYLYLNETNLLSHELNSDAMECYNIEPGQLSASTT